MADYNLKKVTDNSWLASEAGSPIAVILRNEDGYNFMTPAVTQQFKTLQEIKTHLGGSVKEQLQEATSDLDKTATEMINGFPVKHSNILVEDAGERPVYTRGKTQHVAGYWCIKFSKRWVPSYCPLLRTAEQYQSAGPFKNRLEMMTNLGMLNRSD